MSDLFTNGENHQSKTPPDEFKVTIFENPLLSKQVVTRNPNTLYKHTVESLPQYTIGLIM